MEITKQRAIELTNDIASELRRDSGASLIYAEDWATELLCIVSLLKVTEVHGKSLHFGPTKEAKNVQE